MKRQRRPFMALSIRMMHDWAYGGDVLPPDSVVQAKEGFVGRYGKEPLKVSYYSRVLGLNSVILIDANNKQVADLTQKEVQTQFEIMKRSEVKDDFQLRTPASERYWASGRGE